MNLEPLKNNRWSNRTKIITALIAVIIIVLAIVWSNNVYDHKKAERLVGSATEQYQHLIHTKGLPSFDALLKTLTLLEQAKTALQNDHISFFVTSVRLDEGSKQSVQTMMNACLNRLFLPMLNYYYKSALVHQFKNPEGIYSLLHAYLLLGNKQKLLETDNLTSFTKTTQALLPKQKLSNFKHFFMLAMNHTAGGYPIDQTIISSARKQFASLTLEQQSNAILTQLLPGQTLIYQNAKWLSPAQLYIPTLYTLKAFPKVTGNLMTEATNIAMVGNWVLGKRSQARINQRDLMTLTYNDYLMAYANAWGGLLSSIELKPVQSAAELQALLQGFSGPNSTLGKLLTAITHNTNIAQINAISNSLANLNIFAASGAQGLPALMEKLKQTNQQLTDLSQNSSAAQNFVKRSIALNDFNPIQLSEPLPAPLNQWIANLSKQYWVIVFSATLKKLDQNWQRHVYTTYQKTLYEHFPLAPLEFSDAKLNDFNQFFRPHGILQTFLKSELSFIIDTDQTPWQWRKIPGLNMKNNKNLSLLEFANSLTTELYRNGALKQSFTLTPILLSPNADRFILNINNQLVLLDQNTGHTTSHLLWQPGTNNQTTLNFLTNDKQNLSEKKTGPWAFLRILASAKYHLSNADTMELSFILGNLQAHYQLNAKNPELPFDVQRLMQFSLPKSLF